MFCEEGVGEFMYSAGEACGTGLSDIGEFTSDGILTRDALGVHQRLLSLWLKADLIDAALYER